jgi:hypothetical protein
MANGLHARRGRHHRNLTIHLYPAIVCGANSVPLQVAVFARTQDSFLPVVFSGVHNWITFKRVFGSETPLRARRFFTHIQCSEALFPEEGYSRWESCSSNSRSSRVSAGPCIYPTYLHYGPRRRRQPRSHDCFIFERYLATATRPSGQLSLSE